MPPSIIFPAYLLPSFPLPFRRRHSSTSSTSTTGSTTSSTAPIPSINPHTSLLRCAHCGADLCSTSQIISKGFTGRHGRAYLVSPTAAWPSPISESRPSTNLPNTKAGKAVPRQLVTGAHTVSDISCSMCGVVLGWKYVAAEEEGQRYKVGKCILETRMVRRDDAGGWYENDLKEGFGSSREVAGEGVYAASFDEDDEDECEDLFAGLWNPRSIGQRRRGRARGAEWTEGRERGASEGLA